MNILQRAIELAVKNLETAGAQYKIIASDGQVLTNIAEVVEPPRRTRVQTVHTGAYLQVYGPKISAMAVDELLEIEVPEEFNAEHFRASICSYGKRYWGIGSIVTELKGRSLMVLRVEAKAPPTAARSIKKQVD